MPEYLVSARPIVAIAFFNSLIGKVLVGFTHGDPARIISLVPRIYSMTANTGRAQVSELCQGRSIVALREVWDFPDSYNVGNFEGAIDSLKQSGSVRMHMLSPCDADLLLEWKT